MFILTSKISVVLLWALVGYSMVFPFADSIQSPLHIIAAIIAVAHLVEFVPLRNKLNAINMGGTNGFFQTMVFGYGYWLPLLKKDS